MAEKRYTIVFGMAERGKLIGLSKKNNVDYVSADRIQDVRRYCVYVIQGTKRQYDKGVRDDYVCNAFIPDSGAIIVRSVNPWDCAWVTKSAVYALEKDGSISRK